MEKSCSLLAHFDNGRTSALFSEIKQSLESKDVALKIEALQNAIMLLLNDGDAAPHLFITVIRYVLSCDDHSVQKSLLLYLENVDKTDSTGKLLPEIILIIQTLLSNLQCPNEFIRGVTLRFLCRIDQSEILEPLIPSILSNLEHRHAFVRRNAVLAVMSVYNLSQGIVEKFLESGQDSSCKRNAFLMLISCAQDRAVSYLFRNIDRILDWSEQLQMLVLELINKVCVNNNQGEKAKYIEIVKYLLSASSNAVL